MFARGTFGFSTRNGNDSLEPEALNLEVVWSSQMLPCAHRKGHRADQLRDSNGHAGALPNAPRVRSFTRRQQLERVIGVLLLLLLLF